jgi:hypothetical protein
VVLVAFNFRYRECQILLPAFPTGFDSKAQLGLGLNITSSNFLLTTLIINNKTHPLLGAGGSVRLYTVNLYPTLPRPLSPLYPNFTGTENR